MIHDYATLRREQDAAPIEVSEPPLWPPWAVALAIVGILAGTGLVAMMATGGVDPMRPVGCSTNHPPCIVGR